MTRNTRNPLKCDDTDETHAQDVPPKIRSIPEKAIVDFAWIVAQSSNRHNWTATYDSLTPISFEFSGMKEHIHHLEWRPEDGEVYLVAESSRGEYPHVHNTVNVEVWLTFAPLPHADVRVEVGP